MVRMEGRRESEMGEGESETLERERVEKVKVSNNSV